MSDDKRTLAVVIGASEFPYCSTLGGGDAFSNSAEDFRQYLHEFKGLNLPAADVLDLFDDARPAGELLELIVTFLTKRQSRKTSTNVERLLVYYVGHGGFTPAGQEYFLAVRSTRTGLEGSSSIRISDLGHIIKANARFYCQYIVLDCCFSAQAYKTFQTGPGQAAVAKTLDSVPSKGTALLCSSGPREASLAPEGCAHTMFSDAFLNVLRRGDPTLSEFLSLYEVRDLIDRQLADAYQDERVRPQLHCPNQPEGDLSHLPLFPNPAYKLPSTDWRRVIVSDSAPQLPGEIISALRSALPSVRIAALKELAELCKRTSSSKTAELARSEILKRSEEDDSTKVRICAKDALAECEKVQVREFSDVTAQTLNAEESSIESFEREKPALGAVPDLESLNVLLQAVWKLNISGVLEDVLQTLLEAALLLTHAERGFVFLRHADGDLSLAAGRDKAGDSVTDDSTISRSVLRDVASSDSEFLVTDTGDTSKLAGRDDVFTHNLHSVICIPLRKTVVKDKAKDDTKGDHHVQGVLYLDAQALLGKPSSVSFAVLRTIAYVVATLIENASLLQSEDASKRYRQELAIAAEVQQRLMTVTVPDVPFAKVNAVSYACKDIGGDFFDLVYTEKGLSVIVADVSGRGVSAAVVASILQGMLASQLALDLPLPEIMVSVNRFLCDKVGGQKYSTLLIARLMSNGEMELINCGGVPPLLVSGGTVTRIEEGNLPIGLVPAAQFETSRHRLGPNDRLLFVTDGVTEAEDASGEYFGSERLEDCCHLGLVGIEQAVTAYRGDTALPDDFTITELIYRG
jgi:sigma-B regulation protein RsbU (phosphoserine phosphatase)